MPQFIWFYVAYDICVTSWKRRLSKMNGIRGGIDENVTKCLLSPKNWQTHLYTRSLKTCEIERNALSNLNKGDAWKLFHVFFFSSPNDEIVRMFNGISRRDNMNTCSNSVNWHISWDTFASHQIAKTSTIFQGKTRWEESLNKSRLEIAHLGVRRDIFIFYIRPPIQRNSKSGKMANNEKTDRMYAVCVCIKYTRGKSCEKARKLVCRLFDIFTNKTALEQLSTLFWCVLHERIGIKGRGGGRAICKYFYIITNLNGSFQLIIATFSVSPEVDGVFF